MIKSAKKSEARVLAELAIQLWNNHTVLELEELLNACEKWAKEKKCTEFASDCELDNVDSFKFHMSMGFEEANRIICFTKNI